MSDSPPVIRFGDFEVDCRGRRLRKRGAKIKLHGQPFQLLLLLLERPGEVVTRKEMRTKLWTADTFVDFEHGLNTAVKKIRRALGDSAHDPLYVETVAHSGYRFIGSLTPSSVFDVSEKTPRVTPASSVRVPRLRKAGPEGVERLAVLPMENLSGDPEQEYFADGMTEALISDLGKIGVNVISRTSVMSYKGLRRPLREIARELRVGAVVEGSVLRSADRIRITVRLISAATDQLLWAESYERELRDILALQREVAWAIVSEVRVKLDPRRARLAQPRQVNPECHQLYLKGRFFWNKRSEEGLGKGIEFFQKALSFDPTYALAHVGLADCYSLLGWDLYGLLPPMETLPLAKAAATKAAEIDNLLSEAHNSLGWINLVFDWDWSRAEREFKMAIELNPGYAVAHQWYAECLVGMARYEEALAEIRKAEQLDPLSLMIVLGVGLISYFARRADDALLQIRRTLELDPGYWPAYFLRGRVYEQKNMFPEAINEFAKAADLSGNSWLAVAGLGHAYAISGKRAEAHQILNQLKESSKHRYVSAYSLATIYVGLNEKDQAFLWLEKAYEQRSGWLIWLNAEPVSDPLRPDPRFRDLLSRIGLRQ